MVEDNGLVAIFNLVSKGLEARAGRTKNTALVWAAHGGHMDIVQALVAKNVDVDALNTLGATALMWAAAAGHTDIVKFLWESGASLDTQDEWGNTAAMFAKDNGHQDTVKFLEKSGANFNLKDGSGDTVRDLPDTDEKESPVVQDVELKRKILNMIAVQPSPSGPA